MMDASYLVLAVAIGVPVFFAARVVRNYRRNVEAIERARSIPRVDGAVDRYAESDADADAERVWPSSLPRSDSDSDSDGAAFYLAQHRTPGRRAVRRNNGGPRAGRHAPGRDLDFATSQAVGGYDLDGD